MKIAQKNVLGFHVCMNDVLIVDVLEPQQYLKHVVPQLVFILDLLVLLGKSNFKVAGIITVFHKDCNLAFCFGVIYDLHHVRVIECLLDSTLLPSVVQH